MSHDIIVRDGPKRREAFRNLEECLRAIKGTVSRLGPDAEVYLFGSVTENRHTCWSDIDVLVVTEVKPAIVQLELWKSGIREPLEIHVQLPKNVDFYRRRARLTKI